MELWSVTSYMRETRTISGRIPATAWSPAIRGVSSWRFRHPSWTMWYGWKTVMVEPNSYVRTGLLLLALGISSGALGCASTHSPSTTQPETPPQPASVPPETAVTPQPQVAPMPLPATPVETKHEPDRRDSKVIVVEPGGDEEGEVTLVEASRAARELRAHARPPVAVITDKTLSRYATGQVTIANPKAKE